MNEQNSYYAFISYNSADEKWAKWLQHNLEYYHIPSALCKEYPELPKKIRPIFWYKQDLSGTKLKKALNNELNSSKYLIVICSPDSAKADWVNDEVVAFIEQGKGDRIIPFIVAGTPHAKNPDEECFPPALRNLTRDEEIRGIDVRRKEGKYHALVDVIATMFGVRFDVLWQRHERRRKRIRNIWIAVASVFLLCALGIYDYNRTKVEYYADFVDRWGVAEGIIPLDDDQVSHRHHSYKFEYTRVPFGEKDFYSWRLKRVSLVNSKGVISDYVPDHHAFFYPIQEFEYTDGYVTDIINRDTYKRVVMRYSVKDDYEHNTACLIDMEGKEKRQGSAYLDASTTSMMPDVNFNSTKSKIKRFHYTRNEDGYITKITYHANDGDDLTETAIGDNNNIYGNLFELDSLGRIATLSYINNEGHLMTDKFGVGHIRYTYSTYSETETTEFLGEDFKLAYNEQKYAKIKCLFDKYGNIIEQYNMGVDGKPCFDYKNIYCRIITYDYNGCMTEYKCYDFNGNLSYCSDNYAIQRLEYDSKGRCIKVTHYGIDDRPCYTTGNVCTTKLQYNKNDCITEYSYYDVFGNPCVENKNFGVHKSCCNYDSFNNLLEISLYDEDGNNVLSPIYHFATQKLGYNEYHQVISIKNYNEQGEPCFGSDNSCYRLITYDSRGNIIKESFYDIHDNPCFSDEGVSNIEYRYDTYGNATYLRCFDTDMNKIYSKYGHTGWKTNYTKQGLPKEVMYLDYNDSLCIGDSWFAIMKMEYDSRGNLIEESYYDIDSLPCYRKEGVYSVVKLYYDSQNNNIQRSFLDVNRNPIATTAGYAFATYKYNKYRQIIEESYFDINNIPCLTQQSYHKCVYEYNNRGQLLSKTYYSTNNERCSKDGVSKIVYEYDERGNQIKETSFNELDNKCLNSYRYCSWVKHYDVTGRITDVQYFDTNDTPIMSELSSNSGGILYVCHEHYKYDNHGNIIEKIFLDEKGKPTVINGVAKEVHLYDNLNRVIESKYYDENGGLMGGKFGKPIEKYHYDLLGQNIKIQLLESNNVVSTNVCMNYNKGNIQEIYFTDKDGTIHEQAIMNINYGTPYAITKLEYDNRGLNIKQAYYDKENNLYNTKMGYAYTLKSYDYKGRIIKQEFFDRNMRPAITTVGGWHVAVANYDEWGNRIEESHYDQNGELSKHTPYGYSRRLQTYNNKGQCVKDVYHRFVDNQWHIDVYYPQKTTINDSVKKEEEPQSAAILLMLRVEMYGQMYECGFRGDYFILEYNNWNMYDGVELFVAELQKSKNLTKRLVLKPLNERDATIIEHTFSSESLTARIMDFQNADGGNETFKEMSKLYEEWKTNKSIKP